MNDTNPAADPMLRILWERAKELNCLYQIEELLANDSLPLPAIFDGIIRTIPSGWQYPEICQARIIHDQVSYPAEGYVPTPWGETAVIKEVDRVAGSLEVSYTREVPGGENGFFLEKESQLIRTIADRIGQTVSHRQLEQRHREWEAASRNLAGKTSREWMVITDLLRRTDDKLYLHISRKMIYYLFRGGIQESQRLLRRFGADFAEAEAEFHADTNIPSQRQPPENLLAVSDQVFEVAARHLSDNEILACLHKWIHENKMSFLIKAIDSTNTPLGDIIDALMRYRATAGAGDTLAPSTAQWLRVSLIRRFFSDHPAFIETAKRHLDIGDFFDLAEHIIYPAGSNGKLGGKSTGLYLAQRILRQEAERTGGEAGVKIPKTWFMTADCISEFLRFNGLEDVNEQKYKDPEQVRLEYHNIIQLFKNSRFPADLEKGLSVALDDFGGNPIIVRSSSLLEDRAGTAFSGKYKSLFLANQGSKPRRLAALEDAIAEIYASVFGPDPIIYRAEHGLLDLHEEMGIMIQEVVGTRTGPYFLPAYAGVAFSYNEYLWSPRLKREDGLIRLVPGLGTRAVDRVSDDYPVLISPGQPTIRVNASPEDIRHYSPSWIDVINLESNSFETLSLERVIREHGEEIPNVHQIVSIDRDGHITPPAKFEIDFARDKLLVTFEGLIGRTSFVKRVRTITAALQQGLGTPVDIEFASDGRDFYLLQCRPQNLGEDAAPSPIPRDLPSQKILFTARRYVSNGRIPDISHIVYVHPEKYGELDCLSALTSVGRAIGRLNVLLPKRRFILMGPGRWGSRGDIKLGVPVTYADISNTAALIEISRQKGSYSPELSFGTHFFQDLMESGIRYIPLYPDDRDIIFNEFFLTSAINLLPGILPEYEHLADTVRVIDVPHRRDGEHLKILMNAELNEAIAYFGEPAAASGPVRVEPKHPEPRSDDFWRWRMRMAEQIAGRIDTARFGVKAVYVIGSTANATAGPASDIDLLIHFQGSPAQRSELILWLEGWSLSLSEMNYLRTGYQSDGLLDVHLVTDEDIAARTSFAVKIGAVTDPARPLPMNSARV